MAYPSSLDSLSSTRGTASDTLSAVNHVTHHTNEDTAIEALEAKVGVDGSAVTTTHDYKLSGVTGSDKAVSKTGSETLTNKTLTAPVINAGSDATGDIYYRSAGGVFTRLAIGANETVLQSNGTIPAWVANPSASDASYATKGIVRFDTDAATSGVTVTSGVATLNTGTTANKILKLDANAKIPAVDGSQITNVAVTDKSISNASISGTSVTTTQNIDTAVTTTFLPNIIVVDFYLKGKSGSGTDTYSVGTATFDGTTIKNAFYLLGNTTTTTVAVGTMAVGDTSPVAGGDASNGGWTMSIQSLSATGFTLRLTYTQGSTFNGGDYKATVRAFV